MSDGHDGEDQDGAQGHDHEGHAHDDEHNHDGHHDHQDEHAHHDDHHHHDADAVGVAVLTISTSRTLAEDPSGDAIVDLLEANGHEVVQRDLVADDRAAIRRWVESAVADPGVEAAVTTGGTGLSPADVTIPTVSALFDREIAGFGERFRALSADEVGSLAMLSDATAGIVDGVPVFCLPGSENAVELGVSELVLPTVGHVLGLQREVDGPASGEEASGADLTHVDETGDAQMVDVGDKETSHRRAVARGHIRLEPSTVAAIRANDVAKGDVLATTRVGAVDAVKHTWETIPMCHQIPITNVDTEIEVGEDRLELTVAVETVGQTGCEMEAIQGVTTGLGVAWDMVKAAEKDEDGQYPGTRIADVRVLEKTVRPASDDDL